MDKLSVHLTLTIQSKLFHTEQCLESVCELVFICVSGLYHIKKENEIAKLSVN